ncbi:histidine phosphatase family protein [Weissella paramesenteroides]|uniref:histidine phosphatase family protein n=1 Tax=Weissella paramesenteroides TaxID=1249 RepID=UPI003D35AD35
MTNDDFRPLILTGIRQAEIVSTKLQKEPYAHTFAIPLRRTIEMVVPLAQKQNISIETNNLFIERKMRCTLEVKAKI